MPTRRRPYFVGLWLTQAGSAALETRAKDEGLSRSELMRRMLAYAQRMPKGWRP